MNKFFYTFAFSALLACGAPEDGPSDVTVPELALINTGEIGPISEEATYNTRGCNSPNVGVTAAKCNGGYCDNIYLQCTMTPEGVTTTGDGYYARYISEEDGLAGALCESQGTGTGVDGIVDGMRIAGKYADNIGVHCSQIATGRLTNCGWSEEFSEEQGYVNFQGRFATGVRCKGKYCDVMSYYVCNLEP